MVTAASDLPRRVHYVAAVPGDGYGNSVAGYLAMLGHLGVPVTSSSLEWSELDPFPGHAVTSPDRWAAGLELGDDPDTLLVHLPPPQLAAWAAACRRHHRYRRVIGLTTAETATLPPSWIEAVSDLDALIVPSTFNAGAFWAAGVDVPIHVVPHVGLPHAPVAPMRNDTLGDRFTFYAIGPWTTRKGMVDVVAAFLDAFTDGDDVALVVKTGEVDEQARFRGVPEPANLTWWRLAELLGGRVAPPPVLLMTRRLDDDGIRAIHARGDCHVSLNRGEGFGLTLFDAVRAGNPVITTGWGGPLDFLGEDSPLLLRHQLIRIADDTPDGWHPPSDHLWARADHDHAVETLRWVASHRDEARQLVASTTARVNRDFSVEAVAPRLAAALVDDQAPGAQALTSGREPSG